MIVTVDRIVRPIPVASTYGALFPCWWLIRPCVLPHRRHTEYHQKQSGYDNDFLHGRVSPFDFHFPLYVIRLLRKSPVKRHQFFDAATGTSSSLSTNSPKSSYSICIPFSPFSEHHTARSAAVKNQIPSG